VIESPGGVDEVSDKTDFSVVFAETIEKGGAKKLET
jgi:hypothetical protein